MRARCTLMTDAEVQKIHETSMKILREVGVVFSYAPAREMLAKHGCKVEGYVNLCGRFSFCGKRF